MVERAHYCKHIIHLIPSRQLEVIFSQKVENIQDHKNVYSNSICANILEAITWLCRFCLKKEIYFNPKLLPSEIYRKIQTLFELLSSEVIEKMRNLEIDLSDSVDHSNMFIKGVSLYSDERFEVTQAIFSDPVAWSIFELSRELWHVPDGTVEVCRTISQYHPGFNVDYEDSLLSRRKTTGIVELNAQMSDFTLKFVDTGGQRSERKKWSFVLDSKFDILVYVAAISEYNQLCYEDDVTNRLFESIELFSEMLGNKHICDKEIILLLTKTDLFDEKLERFPLELYFPDYLIGTDPKDYIKNRFLSCKTSKYTGSIHVYYVNLLDIKDVERMMMDNLLRYDLTPQTTEFYRQDPERFRKKFMSRPKYEVKHPGRRVRKMFKAIDCFFQYE